MYGLSPATINELCDVFRRFPEVDKVYIFGSRAKGNYRDGSDIDLAVMGKDINSRKLQAISLAIDDIELLYRVDLLDYEKTKKTPIGQHIQRVGKEFYSKSKI